MMNTDKTHMLNPNEINNTNDKGMQVINVPLTIKCGSNNIIENDSLNECSECHRTIENDDTFYCHDCSDSLCDECCYSDEEGFIRCSFCYNNLELEKDEE